MRAPITLTVLAVLTTVAGVLAFRIEAETVHDRVTWHEALYYTLGLFTLAGNRFNYPHTPLLRGLYFAAPLIAASAVIGALLRLVEESGALLIGRFRDHTVIGGLGNLGTVIASDEAAHRQPYIAIERDAEVPAVSDLRVSGDGAVVIGDLTSPEVLRRARCHLARNVFLTARSDIMNLDAAFHVRRLAQVHHVRRPPVIYAHVYDAGLAEALEPRLRAQRPDEADIVTFNSYCLAAKAMLALLLRDGLLDSLRIMPGLVIRRTGWPRPDAVAGKGAPARVAPDAAPKEVPSGQALDEDRRRLLAAFRLSSEDAPRLPLRYVIVGLGRFGRAVAQELLPSVSKTARFLLVERSAASLETQLAFFTAEERARLEVAQGDATSPEISARIHDFAPRAVIICTDNDLGNLRLALELERLKVKTVTRMFDLAASAELTRGLEQRGVSIVGMGRLFRAAIPTLTHERRLRACLNLDLSDTPEVDHLFYLAEVSEQERQALGSECIGLDELPWDQEKGKSPLEKGAADQLPPLHLALVWHRAVKRLEPHRPAGDTLTAPST